MQGAIRYAESIFVEYLRGRATPWPILRDAQVYYHSDWAEFEFRAIFEDGDDCRWRMFDDAICLSGQDWRLACRLLEDVIRDAYRRALEMSRLLAPTDEALRDELMNPPVWFVDVGRIRADVDRAMEDALLYGTGTMYTTTVPDETGTLTLADLERARRMMREASAIPARYLSADAIRYCDCPACRPLEDPAAFAKAIALLRSWLSPSQRASFDQGNSFEVTGSNGGRYRINLGTINNISQLDDSGTEIAHLCFAPQGASGRLAGDAMLAQKIMLENDEAGALKVACRREIFRDTPSGRRESFLERFPYWFGVM